ncbi:anti-sigma factor [Paraburkholderia madseniana]|uniref:Anti-sigma factor n=1 Tax=Paraburkholderia madseniana TaxID=2599607 RepID=A0AAP5EP11_9BURK|nr:MULTISPECIES: anti-sigma factor [Paraburkholderia]MCX4146273.1 anti-sigma factor [Paraburkholderia madseniana]MDN7149219.1 anti-sigma factor [Paraburkholderia sp. WS6]MDQ6408099.1 anti-sigma factor [Paraburkholderia madseniana]
MSDQHMPIGEEDLHAYVDGTLSDERRVEVERALEQNPELTTRVSDYFSLNNMFHERYDRVLSEPVPKRLQTPPASGRRWRIAANWPQFAGMAAALVMGVGIGVGTHMGQDVVAPLAGHSDTRPVSADSAEGFARQAAVAHVVYMPAIDRPADMNAGHEQDFVQWLSNRLGTNVHPPILSKSGFSLSGGRLLPGADGPTAQFMYRGPNGERVTLCISHRQVNANTTAFKLYQDGPVNVFYWVDGDFGYAVSGGIDRKVLLQLSHDVYSQLTGAAPG